MPGKDPTPPVARADVLRIVQRDYPAAQRESILALLDEFTASLEPERVRVAILLLGRGNPTALADLVIDARKDYRDILVAAEYPRSSAIERDDLDRYRQCRDEDRRAYEDWLHSPTKRDPTLELE